MVLYGIPTCDTCRKALRDLRVHAQVSFRDVRSEPLSDAERRRFVAAFGAAIVNRQSSTWRALTEAGRAAELEVLLARHPTLMKRPVIDTGRELLLGWSAATAAKAAGGA